ncbi:MAG TPA: 16S rRNA (adenine(1518)-N(6)/adenine(1519)-N(6))-dimethyltransferase RsmA [Xanthomonadales bacterium]|nr:16S rRNA (adenine(1518)-N(6)/adenine(1519)-N(6))-dimethyltransferase RsmA [Xanthomonadales bacterium]
MGNASSHHSPRKRFGQNFLTDTHVSRQIIQAIHPQPGECIVEIGPGRAALSARLLESGAELHLVEIDRDLAAGLQTLIAGRGKAFLHVADALNTDFSALCQGRRFRLAGNLPYNISTPLLFHVLQWSGLIIDMHFMLQREVVERLAARPGGKEWGRLSIMCQYHCAVTPLFTVPPTAFSPQPRVYSAMVRLVPHAVPPVHVDSMEAFQRLVNQAFTMRRKTLRNCMRGLLHAGQIESAGIDPSLRPEVLSLQQFAALARLMD